MYVLKIVEVVRH